jgi:small subunit ribosomal protein S20
MSGTISLLKNESCISTFCFSPPAGEFNFKFLICNMPIIKSAKKALRGSKRKHVFNLRRKKDLNETVKEVKKLTAGKNKKDAEKLLPKMYQVIDKAAKRGIIKKNTAARKKSRLARMIKKIGK